MPEQPRFDVLERQRLTQERIVEQVDLPDGEVIRRTPPSVKAAQLLAGKRRVTARRGDGCISHPEKLPAISVGVALSVRYVICGDSAESSRSGA
jgi:hypothetical protein